jgi:hypothetical protein
MNRRIRSYYFAVFGGLGGLIAWQISNHLGLSFTSSLFISEAIVGALVGLSVGLFIGLTEGLLTRNPVQAAKSGLFSGLLGLVAGAVALPLGEALFQTVGAGLPGRILGWMGFGMLIGLAEGIVGRSQAWKGMLGGLLGGLLGGALLEAAHYWLSNSLLGKAAGLVLLGIALGAFISLIEVMLSRAWLEVTSGKLKGAEFILDKFGRPNGPAAAIGSSPLKSEIVLPDPDISPQHAMLTGDGNHFFLKDMSLTGTYINNKRVERATLQNGFKIRLGNTEMVYREKRSK